MAILYHDYLEKELKEPITVEKLIKKDFEFIEIRHQAWIFTHRDYYGNHYKKRWIAFFFDKDKPHEYNCTQLVTGNGIKISNFQVMFENKKEMEKYLKLKNGN